MSMQKILAIHPGALGDVILFCRILQELDGEVTLIAGGSKGRLMKGLGAVDKILDFDALPIHEIFTDTQRQDCRLPTLLGRFDRLISCYAFDDQNSQERLASLCGSPSAAFLPIRPTAGYADHLTELWCDMLGLSKNSRELSRRVWTPPENWQHAGQDTLAREGINGPYAVLHPGAGSPEKCWPVENFCELANLLSSRNSARPITPVFILGPVELEKWSEDKLKLLHAKFCVIKEPPMEKLAGLLAGAECFIGNDSGCSHLSAGLGRRTITIFGPTSYANFRPLGPETFVIHDQSLKNIDAARVARELP